MVRVRPSTLVSQPPPLLGQVAFALPRRSGRVSDQGSWSDSTIFHNTLCWFESDQLHHAVVSNPRRAFSISAQPTRRELDAPGVRRRTGRPAEIPPSVTLCR